MIELKQGNLLECDAEAIVNTVNTVGVMGKGVALQFRRAFPEMFRAYKQACDAGEVQPGRMHVYENRSLLNPRYIINFPTKRHWREPSRAEDIQAGLEALAQEVRQRGIRSVALPPLGCGLGGLSWENVLPLIQNAFAALPDVQTIVFPPRGAPAAAEMIDCTERPGMTASRAKILLLLRRYCVLGYELTLLEAQKLLYFLQEAGEPLQLRFQRDAYGPYADNLRHVMHRFEGHFTQGFADGVNKPDTVIRLLPGAVEEAEQFLAGGAGNGAGTEARFQRVAELIEGFESPYGMELLATVHWLGTHEGRPVKDAEAAVAGVHAWSDRKRRMMRADHVRVAWERLLEKGWVPVVD